MSRENFRLAGALSGLVLGLPGAGVLRAQGNESCVLPDTSQGSLRGIVLEEGIELEGVNREGELSLDTVRLVENTPIRVRSAECQSGVLLLEIEVNSGGIEASGLVPASSVALENQTFTSPSDESHIQGHTYGKDGEICAGQPVTLDVQRGNSWRHPVLHLMALPFGWTEGQDIRFFHNGIDVSEHLTFAQNVTPENPEFDGQEWGVFVIDQGYVLEQSVARVDDILTEEVEGSWDTPGAWTYVASCLSFAGEEDVLPEFEVTPQS